MIFSKSHFNILKEIYGNPGIRLNKLIKKSKISSGTAKTRLKNLLNSNIIIEKKITGGKKVLIKNFYPNLDSEEGKAAFSLIELEKKDIFFKKNPNLIGPFKHLLRETPKEIIVILVFGSFANFSQTKDSDLDILFLVRKKVNKDLIRKSIERSFITFKHEVAPRIDTIKNFKLNKNIFQTIRDNHIIILGTSEYIKLIK